MILRDLPSGPAAGHYSHIAVAGGLAFLSGVLPLDAQSTPRPELPFLDQLHLVLDRLSQCLSEVDATPKQLVSVRVFLTRLSDWDQFDDVYRAWIGAHRPARCVVGVGELHFGCALEVEAVAEVPA